MYTLSGDGGETLPVRLRDRQRPCFERGQTNAFVVSYPRGIGDLNYVRIWHDNSGIYFDDVPYLLPIIKRPPDTNQYEDLHIHSHIPFCIIV